MERPAVEGALRQLLEDPKFASSPQMTAFLCYVVEQTLDGNADRIKAFSVGVDALGKPASFDPQGDASVRVLAARLRKNLDEYNSRLSTGAIVIRLFKGSYVPEFSFKSGGEAANDTEAVATQDEAPQVAQSATNAMDDPLNPDQSNPPAPRVAVPLLGIGLLVGLLFAGYDVRVLSSVHATPSETISGQIEDMSRGPVVSISVRDDASELARQLAFALGGVLGRFHHLHVHQELAGVDDAAARDSRSGHYRLVVDVFPAASRDIVGIQILHAADGELVFVDSADVFNNDSVGLAKAFDRLRDSVAMVAQRDGRLATHYDVLAKGTRPESSVIPSLRLLSEVAPAEAVRHGLEAVRLAPGAAESHYALSVALERVGALEDAVWHAANATNRNPYDIQMLLHHAGLVDRAGDKSAAADLRAQIKRIESAAVL